MKLEGNILICKVHCHDTKMAEAGIEIDSWLPFGIDLNNVLAMKLNGEDDTTEFGEEAKTKSALYTIEGVFTVDVEFEELFPAWIKIKNK